MYQRNDRLALVAAGGEFVGTWYEPGAFPNWPKVIPELGDSDRVATLNRATTLAALRDLISVTTSANRRLRLESGVGSVEMCASIEGVGNVSRKLATVAHKMEFKAAFNCQYLIDVFSAARSEEILWSQAADSRPGMFQEVGGLRKFLVMPMAVA